MSVPPQSPSLHNSPSQQPPTSTILASSLGPRVTALSKIYHSALTSTLRANSYANFAACFPTPAQYCPSALEGVWRQLNNRLKEECIRDFEGILEERNVVAGLNEWDEILESARRRRDQSVDLPDEEEGNHGIASVNDSGEKRALHLLSAQEMYAGFLNGYLVKTQEEMEMKLSETQKSNQEMMAEIRKQRAEIESLMGGLEGAARDLEAAVKVLEEYTHGNNNGQDLRSEVWDMTREVAATRVDG